MDEYVFSEDEEAVAKYLTLVMSSLNPSISQAATYELVLCALVESDMSDDSAYDLADLILATVGSPESQDRH